MKEQYCNAPKGRKLSFQCDVLYSQSPERLVPETHELLRGHISDDARNKLDVFNLHRCSLQSQGARKETGKVHSPRQSEWWRLNVGYVDVLGSLCERHGSRLLPAFEGNVSDMRTTNRQTHREDERIAVDCMIDVVEFHAVIVGTRREVVIH